MIISRSAIVIAIFLIIISSVFISIIMNSENGSRSSKKNIALEISTNPIAFTKPFIPASEYNLEDNSWIAPNPNTIPIGKAGIEILYGKELIAHTAKYLGPKGSVAQIANQMNCQNCHNDAGTKPFALNYAAVSSTYPQFKARSSSLVSIAQRINGCFERSLNGSKLAVNSKEMLAIIAYIKWLGKDVPKGIKPKNTGLTKLPYLNREADPLKGKLVYMQMCVSCHGKNGEGVLTASKLEFTYPPLWGEDSYNDGAGLYRISSFAAFVKNNMPFGVNIKSTVLEDEQAWDVAAFVNSQPRPHLDQKNDWKDISSKPIDFPFGPYADNFSAHQHKYGPFIEIENSQKK